MTKKIIDCFIFYNELDLLNYRLNILNNVVDYFIIVESKYTFVGKEKNLIFNQNKHLFENFKDKIIHIIVDLPYIYPNVDLNNDDQWKNEKYQRNSIKNGLDKINFNDEDIIIISDIDEISDPNTLEIIKNYNLNIEIYSLQMDFYYYNLNSKIVNKWYHSKIISYKKYKELNISCQDIREYRNYIIIDNGGWHLSYFGNVEFIKNKKFPHALEWEANRLMALRKNSWKLKGFIKQSKLEEAREYYEVMFYDDGKITRSDFTNLKNFYEAAIKELQEGRDG
jgi:beta-1,4-mannosyl-glycoprotein beta-1,4-N-acetylglucosaminyltransferase